MRSDRPIILMRLLTKDNPAFAYLINDIESKNAKKDVLSYDERRTHNRRIMLKVRIFFHCYTLFTKMFLDVRQKSWKDLLRDLLRREIEKRKVDSVLGEELVETKTNLEKEHASLVEKMNAPWYVLDECHTPQSHCKGFLFHSDYHEQEHTN